MAALDQRPIAYSYIRMSTQQQLKGDSLRRQLDLSEAYVRQHDLILDHSLQDIGVSAWTGANVKTGALGRFLELVHAGRVARGSFLLVESLDRLSRERVIDALEPFLSILRAGIIVVTLADNQVYSAETVGDNFTQLMMSLAIMARAHEESQIKSQRITKAHQRRRENAVNGIGKFSGQMWGWIDQVEVKPNTYEYQLNKHVNVIQKMFELADAGLGCLKIERELTRLGMNGVKGKPVTQGNISSVLKNEAVIGTYQPTHVVEGKKMPYGDPIKDFLPSAISDELYWRVQRNKRKPVIRGRKGVRFANLFAGIACCGHCGHRLMLSIGGTPKQRFTYVQCSRKYKTRDCNYNKGTLRYDVLEKAILDNVTEFQDNDAFSGNSNEARNNLIEAVVKQEEKIAALDKRRASLRATIEFAETDDDRRELAAQMNLRRREVDEAKDVLLQLQTDLQTFDHRKREATEFADRIKIERLLWTTGSSSEVYRSRSRVSLLIGKTITQISVDFQAKQFIVMIGTERAYLFDKTGALLDKYDARQRGYYHTGTRYFAKEVDATGKQWIIAKRPKAFDENTMVSDIPIRTIGEGANKMIAPDVIEARQDRIEAIKRLPESRPVSPLANPRLNDPDVIAIKAKRAAEKEAFERERAGRKTAQHE
ncbi:recombinase family protein [Rhizobium mongolense]|uniref:DNA invertase Pin-like site-specific DNA recombinase n=2 Tax=Rhizobium mongolense TaxID=57676 RepID=A0A559TE12_9HYPH|nr:recombinase family protein [Rhizobium mongolense]TVZ72848.1 DNA invertase Pin-like site-specific DNA recombinase [Rhizobium mongolense USDA 1844]